METQGMVSVQIPLPAHLRRCDAEPVQLTTHSRCYLVIISYYPPPSLCSLHCLPFVLSPAIRRFSTSRLSWALFNPRRSADPFLFSSSPSIPVLAAPTYKMRPLFAQLVQLLFLIFCAALTLAAPARDQVPLGNAQLAPKPGVFRPPFVVKGPPSPSRPVSASVPEQKLLPTTATTTEPELSADKKTAWNMFWNSLQRGKGPPESCFCAGGSVCCHTVHGVNCNYGVCGI